MINVAIAGYGNLGRAAERLVKAQPDMELYGVFSRRSELDTDTKVFSLDSVADYADKVDVLLLCVGSATDIPEHAANLAKLVNTVDTYDNHAHIPDHVATMDAAAKSGGNLAIVSTGWDPGLFSLNRVLGAAVLPEPTQTTFWGDGVSQGHSDALRRIDGVRRAVQYTLPAEEAVAAALAGNGGQTGPEAHKRSCYIVADEADHARIEQEIISMPDYFEPYDTTVTFISEEEFEANHTGLPHGGRVITTSDLAGGQAIEFRLQLASNPDFTAAVQVACARAAARMNADGQTGARTILEIPPYLLSAEPLEELIKGI